MSAQLAELFVWLQKNPMFSGGMGLALVGGALAYFRAVPGRIWSFASDRLVATLTITSDEDAFLWMHNWFSDLKSRTKAYSVLDHGDHSPPARWGHVKDDTRVRLRLGPGVHFIWHQRRLLLVTLLREKATNRSRSYSETLQLQMWRGNRAILEALVQGAKDTFDALAERSVVVRALDEGSWSIIGFRTLRPQNSIILPRGMLDELLNDVQQFRAEEAWYLERGIPHRRGYLLGGPPGNGKSSLAMMIASVCGLDLYVLNLAERGMSDRVLQSAVSDLSRNALLLLEDVDAAFVKREAETGVTFSGVLNALDGVAASEGRVVLMTSNHPELLDPALIRPGRVDLVLTLDNATPEQAADLYERVLGLPGAAFGARIEPGKYSMARLQEHLIRYRKDPTTAVTAEIER